MAPRKKGISTSSIMQSLLACAFISLSLLMVLFGIATDLDKAQNALLSIPITVAIFAVNFSFLEYQFSAYRGVLRGISISHVVAAAGVLLLALVPVLALYLKWSLRIAAGLVIPLVTYASVGLAQLARRNADPLRQLESVARDETVLAFLSEFSLAAGTHIAETEALELSKPGERPTHEWSFRPSPSTNEDDPFAFAFKVASAAMASADLHIFDKALECLLRICDLAAVYRDGDGHKPDYKVQAVLSHHAQAHLFYIANLVRETDKAGGFVRRYQDVCGQFLRTAAAKSRQCGELEREVIALMLDLAKHGLSHSSRAASMVPVVISREVAQKGLDRPDREDIVFFSSLCSYVNVVKELGIHGVLVKNSDFLYRCLDAVGWLGCSCVKKGNEELGKACLQAIIRKRLSKSRVDG